jgi:hypothetical protein
VEIIFSGIEMFDTKEDGLKNFESVFSPVSVDRADDFTCL